MVPPDPRPLDRQVHGRTGIGHDRPETPAGKRGRAERHLSHGPDGSVWGDGPALEFDPARRLVHEWRSLYDPDLADESPSRVTGEIEPVDGGVCKLTLTHDKLDGAPKTAASVGGAGWRFVLSGLKTVVETGRSMSGAS